MVIGGSQVNCSSKQTILMCRFTLTPQDNNRSVKIPCKTSYSDYSMESLQPNPSPTTLQAGKVKEKSVNSIKSPALCDRIPMHTVANNKQEEKKKTV